MFIEFQCPHCEVKLRAGDKWAGEKAACPSCKKEFIVPAQGSQPTSDKEGTAKKE